MTLCCSTIRSRARSNSRRTGFVGSFTDSGDHAGRARHRTAPVQLRRHGLPGRPERDNQPAPSPGLHLEAFNRIKVQVTPRKVRYLINDHLFYEDTEPSPTSPWLGLFTGTGERAVWRNVTLAGRPVIPREVSLAQGDRLEGWTQQLLQRVTAASPH